MMHTPSLTTQYYNTYSFPTHKLSCSVNHNYQWKWVDVAKYTNERKAVEENITSHHKICYWLPMICLALGLQHEVEVYWFYSQ